MVVLPGVGGRIARWMGRFAQGLVGCRKTALDLLLPPRCAHCDHELDERTAGEPLLCDDCSRTLGPELWPHCRHCGTTAVAGNAAGDCPSCRALRLHFDAVIPLGGYQGELRQAVLRMKRPAGDLLAIAMGRLLAKRRAAEIADLRPRCVVPIPMFWARRALRGTNSPEILAECLARDLGLPMARRMLRRRRNTLHQKDLPPNERFQNIRGAFAVPAGYDLRGARVLLVDDILTSGATCSIAAQVLKNAGAQMVAVAVLARAEGPSSR